jgi:putative hemolysin
LPGRFPVHDLPDIGLEVPDGDYATIAGFLLSELGRIPEAPGDAVDVAPWRYWVTGVDERTITEVRVTPMPLEVDDDDAGTAQASDGGRDG